MPPAADKCYNNAAIEPNNPGHVIDERSIPGKYLCKSAIEDEIQTDIYQATLLHKEFAQAINVVILVKTNLKT